MIKKLTIFFIGLIPFFSCSYAETTNSQDVQPVQTELKARLPEWRPHVYEQYPNGSPRLVLFYAESEPVKRIQFFENGSRFEETDLITVDEQSPGYEVWKSSSVPHGVSVRFRENGEIERVSYYDHGLLHGPQKVFFQKGKVQHFTHYKGGVPHGKMVSYHENGQVLAEGNYEEGKLEGDYTRYYETGEKEVLFPYRNGVLHGKAVEWFPSGKERANRLYKEGKLHSEKNQPAILLYGENHSIREIQDFKEGKPHGSHVKYHTNDRKSYMAHYEEGKINGKEQFFNAQGQLQGEGKYIHGKKIGKHWKKHGNGTTAYLALFDKNGELKEAVREFAENGQKIAEYFVDEEGKLNGHYFSWFDHGQLKMDCYYTHGEFEGEQKEFYDNGQIRFVGQYREKLRDGSFKQWYEDGKASFEGTFVKGNKEGTFKDWYANGILKIKKTFKNSLYHGDQFEWYESGKKRLEARFEEGKKDGTHRMWHENGKLIFEGAYDQDMPIGTHVSYFPNGQKRELIHYLAGKKEGLHEIYYEEGQTKLVESYQNDLLEGESKGYYSDGSPAFIRTFKENLPIGVHKEFFSPEIEGVESRRVATIYHYDDEGKLDGEQKTFYPSGGVKTLISYDHGTLHGLKALWDEKGNILEESKFLKGKLEGRHFQKDSEGREIVYHYENNRKEGVHAIYYPRDVTEGEKVKALEAHYKDNELDGLASEFNPSGAQISFTTYKGGVKEGPAQLFHRNGKPALSLHFKNDKREGESKQFYPSGQLYKEVNFVNDLKEGEEKTYFEDGRLTSIYRYKEGKLDGQAQHWNKSGVLIFEAGYQEGLQHGRFVKFYDDGKPRLEQNYIEGKLDGLKKSWDGEGCLKEVLYKNGMKVK